MTIWRRYLGGIYVERGEDDKAIRVLEQYLKSVGESKSLFRLGASLVNFKEEKELGTLDLAPSTACSLPETEPPTLTKELCLVCRNARSI